MQQQLTVAVTPVVPLAHPQQEEEALVGRGEWSAVGEYVSPLAMSVAHYTDAWAHDAVGADDASGGAPLSSSKMEVRAPTRPPPLPTPGPPSPLPNNVLVHRARLGSGGPRLSYSP